MFSLVELLVVIAIIGILAGLLFPVINHALEMGKRADCTNNLRNIGLVLKQYHMTYGAAPTWGPMGGNDVGNAAFLAGADGERGLYNGGEGLLPTLESFQCRSAGAEARKNMCHYLRSWWGRSGLKPNVVIAGDIQSTTLADEGNHSGEYSNLLFVGGSVRGVPLGNGGIGVTGIRGAADPADDLYSETGDEAAGKNRRTALLWND